jgi:hypothetical protein
VANVERQTSHASRLILDLLPEPLHAAEVDERASSCLIPGHAAREILFHLHLEVKAHLASELVIDLPA